MNYFVDTHTHLFAEEFEDEKLEVIQRALDANVQKMLLPNIDLQTIPALYDLTNHFPENCFPMMGIHPEAVKSNYLEVLSKARKEIEQHQFVGIGEIGMDLYWDKTFVQEQKEALKIQLEWAKEFDLPFSMHIRDAFNEVFEVLDEVWDEHLKGVFHCFSGTEKEVEKALSYQHVYFGIGGILTFKKSSLKELIPLMPKDRVVLETDAPYLAPVPMRGKRNESSYIPFVAEKLSVIWQISLEEVIRITSENAQRIFKF